MLTSPILPAPICATTSYEQSLEPEGIPIRFPRTGSGESIQPRAHSQEKSEATKPSPDKSASRNVGMAGFPVSENPVYQESGVITLGFLARHQALLIYFSLAHFSCKDAK